jgi:condensin complex subunit 2
LSAVGLPAPVALEVNSTKFEEWMKLATDNVGLSLRGDEGANGQKITATNTWNFALIDYFADLTLLRNDDDQSQLQRTLATDMS